MFAKKTVLLATLVLAFGAVVWATAPALPTTSSGKGLDRPPRTPQAPQAAEIVDEGGVFVPAAPVASYAPIVLWNQPLSGVNTNAYVDQDFSDYPAYSSYLLDDFANVQPWNLTAIFIPGLGWNGFTTLANATALNWAIYADDGTGLPDGWPGGGNAPFWSLSLPPGDPQVTITNGSGGQPSNTLLTLSAPVALPPGTWWLCFWPEMAFSVGGQYGRQPSDTTNGSVAKFINPGGGFGLGTGLQDWFVLGPAQQDMAFRLDGELAPCTVLHDNGPLTTHPAACAGDDASRLQSVSLGMNTLGFGHQFSLNYRVADDFTVPAGGWQVDQVAFYAYQTGAGTTSPITGVYYQIWDGSPDNPGSTVVFGDLVTNRLLSTEYFHIQRDSESSNCANNRYLFRNLCSAGVFLPAGTYWIEWMTDGSLSSGPWAPPITILGQTTTGNALQFTGAWAPAQDSGTLTQQGFPFVLFTCTAGCPAITISPVPPLAPMVRGVPYTVTFTASGGTAPYTYTLTGDVPPGLVFDGATGTLSGTPTWVGSYNFTIEATDDNGCTGSQSYSLTSAPNYGLHFHDNYGRSDLCIDAVTGSYRWTILATSTVYEGMGVVANGGTAFWTAPSDPVYIYATHDVRRKRARAYFSDSGSGAYSTIVDTNTTDNGPCP